jgi:hypothetical protein
LRSSPFVETCGHPLATGSVEDPRTCSNTVAVNGKCNLAGTVNYATAGVVWRLCDDFYRDQPWWGYADVLNNFSQKGMEEFIAAWKIVDWDDAGPPTAFADATYVGGPAANPAISNRAQCTGACPVTGVPAFTFRWLPFH